jgi:hypothetical protein
MVAVVSVMTRLAPWTRHLPRKLALAVGVVGLEAFPGAAVAVTVGGASGVDGAVCGLGAWEQPTAPEAAIPAVVSAIINLRFMIGLHWVGVA